MNFTFPYMLPPGARRLPEEETVGIDKHPLLPLTLGYGGKKTPLIEGLVDSGATDLLIPLFMADSLNLPHIEETPMHGVGGEYPAYKTRVELTIGRGGRTYTFGEIDACISGIAIDSPLLIGHKPLFMVYKVIFDSKNQMLQLIENK